MRAAAWHRVSSASTCERFRDENGVSRCEHHRPNQDGLVGTHGLHARQRFSCEVERSVQGVLELGAEEVVSHLDGVGFPLDAEELTHLLDGEHRLERTHDQGVAEAIAVVSLLLRCGHHAMLHVVVHHGLGDGLADYGPRAKAPR